MSDPSIPSDSNKHFPIAGRDTRVDLSKYTVHIHGRNIIDYEKIKIDNPSLYKQIIENESKVDREEREEHKVLEKEYAKDPTPPFGIERSERSNAIGDQGNRVDFSKEVVHERESQTQLSARLAMAAEQVVVGTRYMHYKQFGYKVLALALREEDNEPCVVYQAEYGDHITFIRPVADWIEEVEVDGKRFKRFRKIEE